MNEELTVEQKREKLKGLSRIIALNDRKLNITDHGNMAMVQSGLKTKLQKLLVENQHKELDMKIEAMEKVIAILKKPTLEM